MQRQAQKFQASEAQKDREFRAEEARKERSHDTQQREADRQAAMTQLEKRLAHEREQDKWREQVARETEQRQREWFAAQDAIQQLMERNPREGSMLYALTAQSLARANGLDQMALNLAFFGWQENLRRQHPYYAFLQQGQARLRDLEGQATTQPAGTTTQPAVPQATTQPATQPAGRWGTQAGGV
ncbi:MAG TPA: hypothetical protein PK235_19650, partial [Phycisphaerae bacterium]|nr:hypothetical protein [Phycisphaerae bacterium]